MSVLDEDEGGEVASALLCYPLAMRSLALSEVTLLHLRPALP